MAIFLFGRNAEDSALAGAQAGNKLTPLRKRDLSKKEHIIRKQLIVTSSQGGS
jgi:hypothetical protein